MDFMKIGMFLSILQLLYMYHAIAENLNEVQVIVNGEIITEFDVQKRMVRAFSIAESRYSGFELEQRKSEIISIATEELIDRKLLVQEAKMFMSINPGMTMRVEETLQSFVKGAVDEVGSIYKFYELANKQGINPLEKRVELREDIMVDELLQANVYSRILVTPKEIRKYYRDHIDEFSTEGKLSFRQILIKYSSYNTKDEAKAAVDDLLVRLRGGEEFDELAINNSKGPHAEKGGLWEFEEVRDFRKDFLKVISNLKKDEVSEIIKSSIGYHIFKVEEIESEQISTFQVAQDQIYKIIFRDKFQEKKNGYLKELRDDATIERHN